MSGQSASLSLEEARKMQIEIQHPKSQAREASKNPSAKDELCKVPKHQS